jgi:hypothetical protein
MGPDGFGRNRKGKKVWFLTTNNVLVEAVVSREVIRTFDGQAGRDYTILLFTKDLPDTIETIRVTSPTELAKKYHPYEPAPYPILETEQAGSVSARIPGFTVNTWKLGDSGAPNLLPLPGELVFVSGRSTSGPSAEMQSDMDELCRLERLDAKKYQLQWVDLSKFPTYP